MPIVLLTKDSGDSTLTAGRLVMWNPSSGEVRVGGDTLFRTTWPHRDEQGNEMIFERWLWDGRELVDVVPREGGGSPTTPIAGESSSGVPVRTLNLPVSVLAGPFLFDGRWLVSVTGSDLVLEDRGSSEVRRRSVALLEPTTAAGAPLAVIEQDGLPEVLVQYLHPASPGAGAQVCGFALATFRGNSASWRTVQSPPDCMCDLQNPGAVVLGDRVLVVGVGMISRFAATSEDLTTFLSTPAFDALAKSAGVPRDPNSEASDRLYLGAWGNLALVSFSPRFDSRTWVVWAFREGKMVGGLVIDGDRGVFRSIGGTKPSTVAATPRLILVAAHPVVMPVAGG